MNWKPIMNVDFSDAKMDTRSIDGVIQPVRANTEIETVVNRALAAAFLTDIDSGVAIMRQGGVPPNVVDRVLQNPERRRSIDWKV
jgi:hypothetical protein